MKIFPVFIPALFAFSIAFHADAAPGLSRASESGLKAMEAMSAAKNLEKFRNQTRIRVLKNDLKVSAVESSDSFATAKVSEVRVQPNGDVVQSHFSIPDAGGTVDSVEVKIKDGGLQGTIVVRPIINSPYNVIQSYITESIDGISYRMKTSSEYTLKKNAQVISSGKISQAEKTHLEVLIPTSGGSAYKKVDLSKFDGKVIDWKTQDTPNALNLTVYTARNGNVYESQMTLLKSENGPGQGDRFPNLATGKIRKVPEPLSDKQIAELGFLAKREVFIGTSTLKTPRGMEIGKDSASGAP